MSKTDTKIKIKPNLALAEPPLYKIIYINDEVTSMNFVVSSLISYFNYNEDTATSLTENIHHQGSAVARRQLREPVGGDDASAPRHVAREDLRIAGNIFRHMARKQPGTKIIVVAG